MSLFDRTGNKPNTIIFHEIKRSRNESFGTSFCNDAMLAAGPAAAITNSMYRKKALKAIAKRNKKLGTHSEYLEMLCSANVGDNVSIVGNMTEANLFNYICIYCRMELMVDKRNRIVGSVSPSIEEKLNNPPAPGDSHTSKIAYVRKIEAECAKDIAKAKFSGLRNTEEPSSHM